MAYPMGEAKLEPLRVDFDRRVKLEFHGSDILSDGGFLPYRELDHALELTALGGEVLSKNSGWLWLLLPSPAHPSRGGGRESA